MFLLSLKKLLAKKEKGGKSIYLQTSVSIQPRTNPPKFCKPFANFASVGGGAEEALRPRAGPRAGARGLEPGDLGCKEEL